jgi:hypothetical protein
MPMKTSLTILLLLTTCSAFGIDLRYWIEPCTRPETLCRKADVQLAEWALEAWQAASDGKLHLERTEQISRANIRLHWADSEQGQYGETRSFLPTAFAARKYSFGRTCVRWGPKYLQPHLRTICCGKPSSI